MGNNIFLMLFLIPKKLSLLPADIGIKVKKTYGQFPLIGSLWQRKEKQSQEEPSINALVLLNQELVVLKGLLSSVSD